LLDVPVVWAFWWPRYHCLSMSRLPLARSRATATGDQGALQRKSDRGVVAWRCGRTAPPAPALSRSCRRQPL